MKLLLEIDIPDLDQAVDDSTITAVVASSSLRQVSSIDLLKKQIEAIERDPATARQYSGWSYD